MICCLVRATHYAIRVACFKKGIGLDILVCFTATSLPTHKINIAIMNRQLILHNRTFCLFFLVDFKKCVTIVQGIAVDFY